LKALVVDECLYFLLVCNREADYEFAENGTSHWSSWPGVKAKFRANIDGGDLKDRSHLSVGYPDCWDEDQEALDELMATLRER
jgi:hypothetical protein